MIRWLSLAVWVCVVTAAPQPNPNPSSAEVFDTGVKPILEHYCYGCHNSKLQSGALNLEGLSTPGSFAQSRAPWELILRKLEAVEMPPKGLPHPSPAEYKKVTGWIQVEFERLDGIAETNPGRVTARRLNRTEYNNTIRDLLGVHLQPADDFPQDDSGYGFDDIGDVLSLSPVLMERYLQAAEVVARAALFGPAPLKPTVTHYQRPPRGNPAGNVKGLEYTVKNYDVSGLTMPGAFHLTHRFPADGEYVIRATPTGSRAPGSDALVQMAVWLDNKQAGQSPLRPLAEGPGYPDEYGGLTQEFRIRVTAGEHRLDLTSLRQFEGMQAKFGGPNPSKLPPPPLPDLTVLKPPPGSPPDEVVAFYTRQARGLMQSIERAGPIGVGSVDVAGPYNEPKEASEESLKKIYSCGHLHSGHGPECARQIVGNLALRGYRRPLKPGEVDRLLSLVALAQKRGDSFAEGIGLAIQAILVSPQFLFRIEQASAAVARPDLTVRPIGQFELATRLAYFLWSSMPDEELSDCARKGILRHPEVLAGQVKRMLQDPKSTALADNFGGQWLETRRIETVAPDPARFPAFDDYLRWSMRQETKLFLDSILREQRSILDLLDAKYTFLNERLAKHYGIRGVTGPEFRRVDLAGTPRGGVLTQGSVLTVTSYATRTSVVLRGKWILENILNSPVPPPPPDVPALDEKAIGKSVSQRQQMEAHRANAVCASCHSRMDPLGFGMENFDGTGAWRSDDGKFPIDASGVLPNGKSFNGPVELEAVLKTDRDVFARALTSKMLTYALGRGLERYDDKTVAEIATRLAADNYKYPTLILEIVKSLPFQMWREEKAITEGASK
jgi:hypothetical protein